MTFSSRSVVLQKCRKNFLYRVITYTPVSGLRVRNDMMTYRPVESRLLN